jgi:hypothetical protein
VGARGGAGAGGRELAPEDAGSRSARRVVARGRGEPVVVCAAVAGWAEEKIFTVVSVCAGPGVAESGSGRWEKGEALRPRRTRRRAGRRDRAPARPAQSGTPGVRRVHAGLAATGYVTSTNRVHRPRARAPRTPPQDLARPRHPRRRRRHRRPRPRSARTPPPGTLTRDGAATFPHRGAAGGAPTEMKTWQGRVFLATVIDPPFPGDRRLRHGQAPPDQPRHPRAGRRPGQPRGPRGCGVP